MTLQTILLFATVALIVIMSLAAFAAFSGDKKRAIRGQDRIKEKTLLALSAFFGSFGAEIGRVVAHHKTDKKYFGIVIRVSMLLQAALVAYLAYLAFIR